MGTPEQPSQDHYLDGFDVVRIISSEFGSSPDVVRRQLTQQGTQIEIEGELYMGDRLFIPVAEAQDKIVAVVAPDRQWRMRFPKLSE